MRLFNFATGIEKRFQSYEQVLRGVAGLMHASQAVTRDEFRAYADTLQLAQNSPGFEDIGFVLKLPATDWARQVAGIRAEGYEHFILYPASGRDSLPPMVYLQPFAKTRTVTLSHDMYAGPAQRAAMELARDENRTVISSKKALPGASGKRDGFIMFVPVYRNGSAHKNTADRRTHLIGWTGSPLYFNELTRGTMGEPYQQANPDLRFSIYEGDMPLPDKLVYLSSSAALSGERPRFVATRTIDLAGQHWTVQAASLPSFEALASADRRAGSIAAAGVVISMLVAFLVAQLIGSRQRIAARANEINQDLLESEQRWTFAIEGAGHGVWDINLETGKAVFSRRWKEMLGLSEKEVGSEREEWEKRVHPDDLPRVKADMQSYLEGGTPFYANEHRVRYRDGSWKWILTRGMVVKRDEHGRPLRIVGTHSDISEIKILMQTLQESHDLLAKLSHQVPGALFQYRLYPDGRACMPFAGEQLAVLFDIDPKPLYDDAAPLFERVHPEDRTALNAAIVESAHTLQRWQHEFRILPANATACWRMVSAQPEQLEDGSILWHGIATDITKRHERDEALQLASSVYESSGEAILVTDAENCIVSVNPAFTQITGYALSDVLGRRPMLLSAGRNSPAQYRAMWEALEKTGQWKGEIWNRRKNGEVFVERISINTIYDERGRVLRRVAMFSDITEKKSTEELVWSQANYDTLTNLPNRRLFHDRLRQELKKSNRAGHSLALLFIDLDHFKDVNDTLGHHIGDLLLQEAAHRIGSCVRESDTAARLGGDEFTVILADLADTARIEQVAQQIISALTRPFQLGTETAYVSASVGITLAPNDGDDAETLLRNADQAMYLAKELGRNRFSYFTRSMQVAAQTRLQLGKDLRTALDCGQLQVYYQPIIDLTSGQVVKAEALVRWQHPARGMISPSEFIPLAEELGLINDIGDWVFQETARQIRQWMLSGSRPIQVSVNKSPRQFVSGHTNSSWPVCLEQLGLPPDCIVIEITEGLLLNEHPEVVKKLRQFRESGMEIALDDFGTGYSALSYLKKFRLDYLKIDQSFVRDMSTNAGDRAIIQAIIVMAHKLGLKVIAEGVETAEQRDLLAAARCDFAQGYLFSHALPPAEFDRLRRQWQDESEPDSELSSLSLGIAG